MFFGVAGRAGEPEQKDFLYARQGPWPQPSPIGPLGHAAEVLHLPREEWQEFDRYIGSRYKWTLLTKSPGALVNGWRERVVRSVSDAEFDRWLGDGIYSKFLCATLDANDREHFAPVLTRAAEHGEPPTWFKIDLTPMGKVQPYPGMYVAATCTLLRQDTEGAPLRAVAISIDDGSVVVEPRDRDAWDLAKYFVLQGLSYGTLFTQHPNVHFPYDTVNAVTKGSVPTNHVLFKLLIPHLQFSLALDNSVLESKTTVISNDPRTLYDPFCARASDGLMDFFVAGYRGIPGNSAYHPYRYVMTPKQIPSKYGAFINAYWTPVREFVQGICDVGISPGDPVVSEWAHWIAQWLPGFPDEHTIWEGKHLVDALTSVIWNCSIVHSADHADFARSIPNDLKCLRLRLPPPVVKDAPAFDRADLMHWLDVFQTTLANEMFFQPSNVTRLVDVRYGFDAPSLRQLCNRFQQRLRTTEADLRRRGIPVFIALEDMAASIQY